MALTPGLQLGFGLQVTNPVPADSWAGPYASVLEANTTVISAVRFIGREVIIFDGVRAKVYGWYTGILDTDLEEQQSGGNGWATSGTTNLEADVTIDGDENNLIFENFASFEVWSRSAAGGGQQSNIFLDHTDYIIGNADSNPSTPSTKLIGNSTTISLSSVNSSNEETFFRIQGSSIITSSAYSDFAGIEYAADYSAFYSDRSLVDKGYADGNFLKANAATSLTSNTTIDWNSGNSYFQFGSTTNYLQTYIDDGTGVFSLFDMNSQYMQLESTGSTPDESSSMFLYGGYVPDPTKAGLIEISSSKGLEFRRSGSDVNFKGIYYQSDYSANFTARSLVDKAYVDSVAGGGFTFENGLTETAGVVKLGGSLTESTTITTTSTNSLTIDGSGVTIGATDVGTAGLQVVGNGVTLSFNDTYSRTLEISDSAFRMLMSAAGVVNSVSFNVSSVSASSDDGTNPITMSLDSTDMLGYMNLVNTTSGIISTIGVGDDEAFVRAVWNATSATAYVGASANGGGGLTVGALMGWTIAAGYNFLIVGNEMLIESTIPDFEGLKYADDYSTSYTSRSLVDKEYVDNVIGEIAGGHIIESNDSPLPYRPRLNFVGGLKATDDAGNDKSNASLGGGLIENVQISGVDLYLWDISNMTGITHSIYMPGGTGNTQMVMSPGSIQHSITADAGEVAYLSATVASDTLVSLDLVFSYTGATPSSYNIQSSELATTGGLTFTTVDEVDNSVRDILILRRSVSDLFTPTDTTGLGLKVEFRVEVLGGLTSQNAGITYVLTDGSNNTTISGKYVFTLNAGDAYNVGTDILEIDQDGAKYIADYSANFTARSLVDKAYVDSVAGGGGGYNVIENAGTPITTRTTINVLNGLVAVDDAGNTSSNIKLGGPLTDPITYIGDNTLGGVYLDKDGELYGVNATALFTGDFDAGTATSYVLTFNEFVTIASKKAVGNQATMDFQSDTGRAQIYTAVEFGGNIIQIAMRAGSSSPNHYLSIGGLGTTPFKGVEYDADYSANFTARSLIDKGYADATYTTGSSTAFWKTAGTSTLTANVDIAQGGFDTTFTGNGTLGVSHTATVAGFRIIPATGDPSGVVNGNLWYNSTDNGVRIRQNNLSVPILTALSHSVNRIPYFDTIPGQTSSSANLSFDGTSMAVGAAIAANVRLLVSGIGSGTTALFRSSSASDMFIFDDTGLMYLGSAGTIAGRPSIGSSAGASTENNGGMSLVFRTRTNNNNGSHAHFSFVGAGSFASSGSTQQMMRYENTFALATSTATYSHMTLRPTYNTTGSFTGTAYGVNYDPVLTSVTGLTHVAYRATSGAFLLGGTTLTAGATVDIRQYVSTSGTPVGLLFTGAAHTTIAASETHDLHFNLGRTVQFTDGSLSIQRAFRVQAPTYSFVSAGTISDAITFQVDSAPIQGTGATITRAWAARFNGNVTLTSGSLFVGMPTLSAGNANTRLDVRGLGTTDGYILRLANNGNIERLSVLDNGTVTITTGVSNSFVIGGTWSASASNQYAINFAGNLTATGGNGDVFSYILSNPTLNYGTYSSGATTIYYANLAPTYNTSNITGTGTRNSIGIRWAPVISGAHTALQIETGNIRLGETSGNTHMLQITAPSGTGGIRYQQSTNVYFSAEASGGFVRTDGQVSAGTASGTRIGWTIQANTQAPTAGSHIVKGVDVTGTINTTGTYSGGTYVAYDFNPTINSATGLTILSFRAAIGAMLLGGSTLTDANTILDIQSTTRGVALPRMTTGQRDAIPAPYSGLFIYNITTNALNYYNGTSWSAVGGGGGISSSAVVDEILVSDGTNAIGRKIYSTSNGNLRLGDSGLAGSRLITVESSDANSGIGIYSKGTGAIDLILGSTSGLFRVGPNFNQLQFSPSGRKLEFNYSTTSTAPTITGVEGSIQIGSNTSGSSLVVRAGNASSGGTGLANGGHLYLNAGAQSAQGGDTGNMGLLASSVANWQSMELGIFIANIVVAPTGNPSSGLFAWSSTEPEGSNLKIRTSGGHFAKPVLQAKVTVAGGAALRGIGTTPVTIISAPGANKYINIISVTVSYKYGTAAYDFAAGEIPQFEFSGSAGQAWRIPITVANSAGNYHLKLSASNDTVGEYNSISQPINTAFVFTTDNGGDATTGDGDMDVIVYYTIENENT